MAWWGTMGGELAALGAAICWAVAVALFRAPIAAHGARAINLAKNAIAGSLLGITMLALGQGGALVAADPRSLLLIAASGLVGLTLGDTALFSAVARVGPPRALLLQCFAPVFTALLAYLWSGDLLGGRELAGGLVILVGVGIVLAPGLRAATPATRGQRMGLMLGLLAAFGQGAGIVLAKEAMATMPIVAASFVRMSVAALGLIVVLGVSGRVTAAGRALLARETAARLLPASMLGTYLAFLLMMAGVAWSSAAVAAVLLSTVPVWSLLVDAVANRRWIQPAELVGTLVAVAGVAIVTTG